MAAVAVVVVVCFRVDTPQEKKKPFIDLHQGIKKWLFADRLRPPAQVSDGEQLVGVVASFVLLVFNLPFTQKKRGVGGPL